MVSIHKARFTSFIRKVFEEDADKIDEEVSEKYGITKEELHPKKYENRKLKEEEQLKKDNKVTRPAQFNTDSKTDTQDTQERVEEDYIEGKNSKVVNLWGHVKKDVRRKDKDELRIQRLLESLQEDMEIKYETIKIGVNFDETDPYGLNYVVSNNKDINLNFSLYYIFDKNSQEFLYRQGDSRVDVEDKLRLLFKGNAELNYILDRYIRAVKLNHNNHTKN